MTGLQVGEQVSAEAAPGLRTFHGDCQVLLLDSLLWARTLLYSLRMEGFSFISL